MDKLEGQLQEKCGWGREQARAKSRPGAGNEASGCSEVGSVWPVWSVLVGRVGPVDCYGTECFDPTYQTHQTHQA